MTSMVGLYVEYKARTAEVDAAMSRMSTQINKIQLEQASVTTGFDKMATGAGRAFKVFAGGLALTAVAGIFGSIAGRVSEMSESIDELSKSAGTLGIPVSSLQRLQYVASLAGVSTEQLEKSFQKMSKTLGQAFTGKPTLQLTAALKAMHLSLNDLKGLSADQQYMKIADAIGSITDKNIQASSASVFFGRDFSSALKMVRQGVGETTKEFDKMGLAMSDSQAQAIEDMNDAQTRLSTIWGGFSQKLVIALAPGFKSLSDSMSDLIKQLTNVIIMTERIDTSNILTTPTNLAASLTTGIARNYMSNKGAIGVNEAGDGRNDPRLRYRSEIPSLPAFLSVIPSVSKAFESIIPPIGKLTEKLKEATDTLEGIIKSQGQEKLKDILGKDINGEKLVPLDNPEWNESIRRLYDKAINGGGGVVQSGGFNGKAWSTRTSTAAEDLKALEDKVLAQSKGGKLGEAAGYIGAIEEMRALVKKIDPNTNKVKLDITVNAEEGLALKIAQSEAIDKAVQLKILDNIKNAAIMGTK